MIQTNQHKPNETANSPDASVCSFARNYYSISRNERKEEKWIIRGSAFHHSRCHLRVQWAYILISPAAEKANSQRKTKKQEQFSVLYILLTDTITSQNASCAGRNLMLDRELVQFASEKTNLDKSKQYYHIGRTLTVCNTFFIWNQIIYLK